MKKKNVKKDVKKEKKWKKCQRNPLTKKNKSTLYPSQNPVKPSKTQ